VGLADSGRGRNNANRFAFTSALLNEINNAFGGFWGSGVTFDVRQLYVRGVVANAFRYQIGNIDYKLSPFTCFNHDADRLIPVTGVQRIKQDIVEYITDPINQWLPDIELMNIDVQTTDDDPNLIHDVIVTITFRPVYSAEEKTLTLGVNQTGTLTVTP
jgi:hypothetical protein